MTDRATNPSSHRTGDCLGAVLAGGRSRRMGGARKALVPLAGRALILHAVDCLAPQVDTVVLSVDRPSSKLAALGLPQVPDPAPGSNGPLGGLAAVLGYAAREGYEWLQLLPCDAPWPPSDLAHRLYAQALRHGAAVVVPRYAGRLQPVFSLWSCRLHGEVDTAVTVGALAGFHQFLDRHEHGVVEWPEQVVNPFFNINDRAALAEAERLILSKQENPA